MGIGGYQYPFVCLGFVSHLELLKIGSDLAYNGLLSDGSYLKLATGLGYSAQHSGVCASGELGAERVLFRGYTRCRMHKHTM